MKNIKFHFISKLKARIGLLPIRESLFRPSYLVFFCLFGLIPLLLSFCYHFWAFSRLHSLKEEVAYLQARYEQTKSFEERKEKYLTKYAKADPYFLDKKIETLSFLHPECQFIATVLKYQAFENCEELRKRLDFIKDQNHLVFNQIDRKKALFLEETVQKQMHPIEVNTEDLQKILSYIEGVKIGDLEPISTRPQIFIKEFELIKKQKKSELEVFTLQLELLQREVK